MSRCIYETHYLPWVGREDRPWKYSGSNYRNDSKYLGSASSKLKPDWADGLTIEEWWKRETKENPQNFRKYILLEVSDDISRVELQSLESAIQTKEDHRNSNEYFNRTNKHFNTPLLINNPIKGMSYEEIYGKERAEEIKKARSDTMKLVRKNKHWSGNNEASVLKMKGKTYEEIYGPEKAAELIKIRTEHFKRIANPNVNQDQLRAGTHVSQQKVQCEHCNKILDKANYSRWHGDKCKSRKI